ncbi:MAG: CNP1-like family protein [Sulfuricaulis sp.]
MQGTHWFSALGIGGSKFSHGRRLLFAALVLTAQSLHADAGNYDQNIPFDEKYVEKWKESQIVLPSYPDDRNLIPVPMNVTDTLKIYIDGKSISRAKDLVARFSLVVESPSGARSVFYDGLRCETRQYKTYAIGSAKHSLEPASDPQWRPIPRPEINAFRDDLYRRYVCDSHNSARSPQDIVRALTYQP